MKYRLTIDFDAPEKITSWDIRGAGNIKSFLRLCLSDFKIDGFICARLDGPDTTEAIENCETVESMGPRS